MLNGMLPFGVALGYALGLFALAAWVERRRDRFAQPRLRRPAYMLALAVYCTSWTFFGAVGSAATEGWNFLPITLGPALVYVLAPRLLTRLIAAVQHDGASSISDFIGSRFGKSQGVAALVTLLALFGTVPYLALQLRSVGTSFAALAGGDRALPMIATAIMLAAFAIVFGTRRYSVSGRNEALLYAVAIESLVKVAALLLVAGFAILALTAAPEAARAAGLARFEARFAVDRIGADFVVITLLAMAAIICLPRQFYIGVVEAAQPGDAIAARWPFVGYLVVTTLAVIPIALAGLTVLPTGAAPDLFVLSLPLSAGANGLALLVFLGGFSAAIGMAVVETIALATMVSNDIVGPLLLRRRIDGVWLAGAAGDDVGWIMLIIRRLVIIGVMIAAISYALILPDNAPLAGIGLIAFAAMAQFAPVLLIAGAGGPRDAAAAQAGLATGLILWGYTLLLPGVGGAGWLSGLKGSLLDPTALLGIAGASPLAHGVLWSLGGNLVVFVAVASRRLRPPQIRIGPLASEQASRLVTTGALADMAERFAGRAAVTDAFGDGLDRALPVDVAAARIAERLIAGVVGVPSARAIMASALSGTALRINDIARMLDERGESLQFSKGLLAATLENIDPGVSVIDRDLRLVAWNSQYLDLFRYPLGLVRVGTPVADLIRYNALRGECGPGEVEDHVVRRLDHIRRAQRHSFERTRPDGRVIKTVGGPMRGGGYVMCFTDISAEAEARAGLERARAQLEARVVTRTRELQAANAALARATEEKTRFLAAASHDLLQPLHAARLFSAALASDVPPRAQPLLANVDRSIAAADELLRALLDISSLDAGGITPMPSVFSLRVLLAELVESFAPLAAEKSLRLSQGCGDAWVSTDRNLLRSILQNFLSNAVRYTARGGVVIGLRRRGARVRIEVVDTGCGIAAAAQQRVFREFERLGTSGEAGIGLGLAIVERTARLLDVPVDLVSVPGRGSRFAVTLLRVEAVSRVAVPIATVRGTLSIAGLRVLIVDDDPQIRTATGALLERWGCTAIPAADARDALAAVGDTDVALVDFDLGGETNGLQLIEHFRAVRPSLRCVLVTADRSAVTAARCAARGVVLLSKPVEPVALADWLSGAMPQAA